MEVMDSNDEMMFAVLMEEEATVDDEHFKVLSCLLALYARNAHSQRGGSKSGRRKSKPSQRMEGYCMLYADYFADDPMHGRWYFAAISE
jgi:hypothetical protein